MIFAASDIRLTFTAYYNSSKLDEQIQCINLSLIYEYIAIIRVCIFLNKLLYSCEYVCILSHLLRIYVYKYYSSTLNIQL